MNLSIGYYQERMMNMKKKITAALTATMAVMCLNSVFAGGGVPAAGDVDCDGVVTASDASALLQRVLNDSTKMPVEKTRSYMYIADADGDDMLTAADAAAVMQKVLDPGTSLAYDGKTYKEWLERKGTDKLDLFEKELETAQTVFTAAQTYAVDLYTKGQWSAGEKVTFPRLIKAELLKDDYKYYKYRIYTDGTDMPVIDRVEWDTQNSPYGNRAVFPRDGHSDDFEIEWGWFDKKKNIGPSEVYGAAKQYIQRLKYEHNWSESTTVTAKDLVKKGFLGCFPETDYSFITEKGEIVRLEWQSKDGKTRVYPIEYTIDGLVDYEDLYKQAKTVFAAAQTYATDMYTKNQWTGEKYIDIESIMSEELLDDYPSYPFIIETTGEKLTPAVKQVICTIGGSTFRYPYEDKDGKTAAALNAAATIFSAASTHATDLYTMGKWSGDTVITTDDLVKAGLLDIELDRHFVIVSAGEDNTPAIHHVEFTDDEGYTCVYPGTPFFYSDEKAAAEMIFSAAQTYATDLYTRGQWSKDTVITVDDLLREGLLLQKPATQYTIHTVPDDHTPAVSYVSWTDKSGTKSVYPVGEITFGSYAKLE